MENPYGNPLLPKNFWITYKDHSFLLPKYAPPTHVGTVSDLSTTIFTEHHDGSGSRTLCSGYPSGSRREPNEQQHSSGSRRVKSPNATREPSEMVLPRAQSAGSNKRSRSTDDDDVKKKKARCFEEEEEEKSVSVSCEDPHCKSIVHLNAAIKTHVFASFLKAERSKAKTWRPAEMKRTWLNFLKRLRGTECHPKEAFEILRTMAKCGKQPKNVRKVLVLDSKGSFTLEIIKKKP